MSDYDDTNTGVIFEPHPDQNFVGQGKVNVDGEDEFLMMIHQRLSRTGEPYLVLYRRAGVLFPNDKKGNDKAPDFTGPLDLHPNKRIAAWQGLKDGRKYMSLKVSEKQAPDESKIESADQFVSPQIEDDEIPF